MSTSAEIPTVLIADDEEAPRAQLSMAVRAVWPQARIVAECVNGADAWDAYLEHEPAVCFLDIRMPGLSGIDVASRIGAQAQVIFVTAYGDHALEAFDAGAVDYLLKPVEEERLRRAVARVQERWARADAPQRRAAGPHPAQLQQVSDEERSQSLPAAARALDAEALALQALLAQLRDQTRRPPALQVIQAAVGKEVRLIPVAEVIYFESDARYTRVVYGGDGLPSGGEALIRTPLKELLTQLDPALFWQVHRSVIVNHRHIASAVRVDEGLMHLVLRGHPEKLPVSRHFQGLFRGQ
jgi:DNA-binding LytR/AlgR family response regulator